MGDKIEKIETEAKIRIDKTEFERILALGGSPAFVKQRNDFYQLGRNYLRLRCEKGKKILTCKGANNAGPYNARKEIEVCLPGEQDIESLLDHLGFNKVFSYTKLRANFSNRGCIVSLDKLTDQYFVEVEGDADKISEVLNFLKLTTKSLERRSYQEILGQKWYA